MDEPSVITSPRPAPISSSSDLLMPALAVLGACVLSIICAGAPIPRSSNALPVKPLSLPRNFMTTLLIPPHDGDYGLPSVAKARLFAHLPNRVALSCPPSRYADLGLYLY